MAPLSAQETVDSIVTHNLDKLGYKYVALDDCWSDKKRDVQGKLQPDARRFPGGMKAPDRIRLRIRVAV